MKIKRIFYAAEPSVKALKLSTQFLVNGFVFDVKEPRVDVKNLNFTAAARVLNERQAFFEKKVKDDAAALKAARGKSRFTYFTPDGLADLKARENAQIERAAAQIERQRIEKERRRALAKESGLKYLNTIPKDKDLKEIFFTPAEAALIVGVTQKQLEKLTKRKKSGLPFVERAGGAYFTAAALKNFLNERADS